MTLVPFRPDPTVRCLGAVLTALFAAGCASYAARPLVPEDELARLAAPALDSLRIEHARATAERVPLVFDARDGLDEAELAALALTIHPALKAKRAAIGEAQALLVSAGLLPNPDLGLFVRPGLDGATGTGLGLEALFGLPRPDERPARRALAEARVAEQRAAIEAAEQEVVAAVRHARLALQAAGQSARLWQQELELREETLALVRRQRELGEATAIAEALVELDRTRVQSAVRAARAAVESGRRALRAALGLPPTIELALTEPAFTLLPDVSDPELDRRLLAGRSELRTRAAAYRVAEEELRLAVARQYPSLELGPSYERDVEGSAGFGLGLSLELPLFDRNQGEIAERAAAREHARAEYVATLHALRARAFEARERLRSARAEVAWQQEEIGPLVQRTEELFAAALRARELPVFEWLAARTRAIEARRDLVDALARYADARVELDLATGTPLVVVEDPNAGDETQRRTP